MADTVDASSGETSSPSGGLPSGRGPDVYIADAATDDDRYYVRSVRRFQPASVDLATRTMGRHLVRKGTWAGQSSLSPASGLRVHHLRQMGLPGARLVAIAGDFVYESPGEGHTLVAYEHPEPMKVHFNVTGPLIWIDEDGKTVGQFDVFDYIKLCRALLQGWHRRGVRRAALPLARGAGRYDAACKSSRRYSLGVHP